MMSLRRFGSVVVFAMPLALPQSVPAPAAILRKLAEIYRSASQYEFVADTVQQANGSNSATRGHMRVAFKAPNLYRLEGQIPGMDAQFAGDLVMVSDGLKVWFYLSQMKQSGSVRLSDLDPNDPGDLGDLRPEAVDDSIMKGYRDAADYAARSRLLRQQTVKFAGAEVNCYVLRVPRGDSTETWWVDSKKFLVLRRDDAEVSITFTSIRIGGPLADELFRFEPPAGATRIELNR